MVIEILKLVNTDFIFKLNSQPLSKLPKIIVYVMMHAAFGHQTSSEKK